MIEVPRCKKEVKKVKKKMFAMLTVALFVTIGFAGFANADGFKLGKLQAVQDAEARVITVNETLMDVEPTGDGRSLTIEHAGYLSIDEDGSDICDAKAYDWNAYGISSSGTPIQVNVDWDYDDDSNICGGKAKFKLTVPGAQDSKEITDVCFVDNSANGILKATFTAYPNHPYQFTVYCEREGHDSAEDIGVIQTYP